MSLRDAKNSVDVAFGRASTFYVITSTLLEMNAL